MKEGCSLECVGTSCRSFPLLFFGQSAEEDGLRGRQLGFDGSHTGVARLSLGVVAVQGFTNSEFWEEEIGLNHSAVL